MIKALCSSSVKELWLYRTQIGVSDSELLKSSHSLQHLHTDQNNLSRDSVTSIITGLSHNSSLKELDIQFTIMNVDSLASLLSNQWKCALTKLNSQDCHISEQGACKMVAALCKNTTLEDLNLSHNLVNVEGATAVAKMLAMNRTLTLNFQLAHIP